MGRYCLACEAEQSARGVRDLLDALRASAENDDQMLRVVR
jgi:hypothetical protein